MQETPQWMFHHAANLFDVPIFSIYPYLKVHQRGQQLDMRAAFNRTIYPANPGRKPVYLAILWCRGDTHMKGTVNHFVPLVP